MDNETWFFGKIIYGTCNLHLKLNSVNQLNESNSNEICLKSSPKKI